MLPINQKGHHKDITMKKINSYLLPHVSGGKIEVQNPETALQITGVDWTGCFKLEGTLVQTDDEGNTSEIIKRVRFNAGGTHGSRAGGLLFSILSVGAIVTGALVPVGAYIAISTFNK